MKHILNNLSAEEKKSILEQHTGGMKVITENFSKLINSKQGDSKPLVNEQTVPQPPRPGTVRKTPQTTQPAPPPSGGTPRQTRLGGVSGNQYKKPPYCKVGQSQGTVVIAQTGKGGPDTSLGETGLALSVNGKVVCLISTKYKQGGYVTRPSI